MTQNRPFLTLPPWLGPALAGLLLLLLPIGRPLTDGDTAYYALIAQHMVETGDWMTLRYPGRDELVDKPPLTIWLIAASYLLFGFNEAAIRLWHVLMSIGTVAVVQATAGLFFSRAVASLAGWVLLTSCLFVYCAFVPQQDMPLTFFASAAFYGFARFLRGDGWRWTYLSWASLALGLLARGPQAVVFPLLAAGITVLAVVGWDLKPGARAAAGPGPFLRSPAVSPAAAVGHLVLGGLVFVAIGAPWFVHQYLVHGWPIIDLLLGAGQARFLQDTGRGPDVLRFWSYVPLLFVALLPWSGWILPSLGHAWRGLRQPGHPLPHREPDASNARTGLILFGAWFLVAFWLPFAIQWRVIRYLLPALPPLAVLIAHAAETAGQRTYRAAAWLSMLVAVPVSILVVAVYAVAFPEEQAVYVSFLRPFLTVLGIATAAFVILALSQRRRTALLGLIAGGWLAFALLFQSLAGYADKLLPAYGAVRAASGLPHPVVIAQGYGGPLFAFYGQLLAAQAQRNPADAAALLTEHGAVVLVGGKSPVQAVLDGLDAQAEVLWEAGGFTVVRASASPRSP